MAVYRASRGGFVGLALATLIAVGCGSGTQGHLAITASPTGEVTEKLEVVLEFTRDMVADKAIGEPLEKSPVSFSPAILGEASWRDQRTLVYVAATTLPASTEFTGTVPATVTALDGNRLGEDFAFKFTSTRLAAEIEVLGAADRAIPEQVVKLSFNQEVSFGQVVKHCHFTARAQKIPVAMAPEAAEGPSKSFVVTPASALSLNTDWSLLCAANLKGTEGDLGMTANAQAKFHTYGPMQFVSLTPDSKDIVPDEDLRLEIAFTNPPAKPYAMELSPPVRGFPERCHSGADAPPALSCAVMLEPNTSYTLTIQAGQTDVFEQTLGTKLTKQFRTSDSQPTLSMETGYVVAERVQASYPAWTRNVSSLEITAAKITPQNFHKVAEKLDWWSGDGLDFSDTGIKPVFKAIDFKRAKNQWGQVSLRPSDYFPDAGTGMYYFEAFAPQVKYDQRKKVLVNFTDIGVVTKLSPTQGLVWATSLSSGKPLPGARVSVRDQWGKLTWSGTTNESGVAILPGRSVLEKKSPNELNRWDDVHVFVHEGDDWTMVNTARTGGLDAYNFNIASDDEMAPVKLRGFMHTDRGLYRPGHTVHIKGLARTTKLASPLRVPKNTKVDVEVHGPHGNLVSSSETRLSRFGGFWTEVELPGDARLGDYLVTAKLEHGTFTSRFAVEEYRPATFEVTGTTKAARLVRTGKLEANVAANYFYGAPVRSGDLTFTVHSRARQTSFPQHEGFSFLDERANRHSHYADNAQELVTEQEASLTSEGTAAMSVAISPQDVSSDADLLLRASVAAPSNEVVSKTFTVPYFRSRRYYGIKAPGYFLEVKKPQWFEVIGVSPSGEIMDGDVHVTVRRVDWNCVWEDWSYRGSYRCNELTRDVLSKKLTITDGKPARFDFAPEGGGEYLIIAEGDNKNFAPAAVELYAWGDGGGSWRSDDSMTFDVVADKTEYRAGDTATLLLKTDLAQATGLVTIERDGVIERRLFDVTPSTKHIQVPITGDYAPNVYVSIALVQGRLGPGRRGKPRMRMGMVNLPVTPQETSLKVTVATEKKDYRPGQEVKATVKVTDAAGDPVSAEVAVTAADEGVLSLIDFQTPNPVPAFYVPWGLGVMTATQYTYIKDIPGPNVERPATGGDSAGPGSVRSRFVSTAIWKPGLVTNARGVAHVTFAAPDNLTAFRVMAVAADDGHRFGSADKRFTVSKPLQLQRVLPRFLTLADKVQAGVVVHNETGAAGIARVKLAANDVVAISGTGEKTVDVPKGGRVPVLFDLSAKKPGQATLTFSVVLGGEGDAVAYTLSVHHPSPERVLRIARGSTRTDKPIAIQLPATAIAASAQVHVSVDPDGLAGIEAGLRDLIQYPYGCLEQTTSRVIPMVIVRELAESLNLPGLQGKELDGFVTQGVAKIGRHQTTSGGFSLWPGGNPEAYYTAYALWGLYLARAAGYSVDEARIQDGLNYLRDGGKRADKSAPHYSEIGNNGDQAFALFVRALLGDKDVQAATRLADEKEMPLYGRAFVARALAASAGKKDPAVRKIVAELSALAAAAAKAEQLITEPNEEALNGYMSGAIRTTAMVIDALVELDQKNPAIRSSVMTLMAKRQTQPYLTTQDNLYSLLALSNYARSRAGNNPSVEVAIDGRSLGNAQLKGKNRVAVMMTSLSGSAATLLIQPKGDVFYNVEVRYRDRPETLKGESNALVLRREYLTEDGKPKSSFQVGDIVRIRLSLPLNDAKNHLMISDRLPAGFEALNSRLATVGPVGAVGRDLWGSHQELHDERSDFSTEYVWRQEYQREYLVRAIAQGRFVVPPAVAELMYEPEENAQTALHNIEIAAK